MRLIVTVSLAALLGSAALLPLAATPLAAQVDDRPRAADGRSLNTEIPDAAELAAVEGPARLRVYFDLPSRARSLHVEINTPFELYVVAVGAEGGVNGWEAAVVLDPRLKVMEKSAGGINVGSGGEWMVGLGRDCLLGQMVVVATYKCIVLDADARDLLIELGPIERTSFEPPSPGYLTCIDPDDLRPFEFDAVSAVVNPAEVQIPRDVDEAEAPRFDMEKSESGSR